MEGRRFLLHVGHIRAADSVISAGAIPAHLPIMQLEAIEPRLCARKFASTRNCGDAYLLAVNLPFSTDLHANTAKIQSTGNLVAILATLGQQFHQDSAYDYHH
ncbi:MAG: hypothetical protein MJY66_07185 [Bacteroidaceae bacterium]|nr:hypothetical protein [Bacteroidaceae bacterium]